MLGVTHPIDDLRAVLRDSMMERGLTLTPTEVISLDRVLKLLKADGCYECAFGAPHDRWTQHHDHHPQDRAMAYRLMLGPFAIDGKTPSKDPTRATLLRILELLVAGGAT